MCLDSDGFRSLVCQATRKQNKGSQIMSTEKPQKKAYESRFSLLQGLTILGVLGLVGAAIARYLANTL